MDQVLRTEDERFEDLPGFAFAPHYLEGLDSFASLRVHYLDEGPKDAKRVFLCLHGHPTWCYLWRRTIPVITAAGHRVVAPDLPGFGRSDKPADEAAYGFERLRACLIELIERLELDNMVVVGHDFGTSLGLTLPVDMPTRIVGLVAMNGILATGDRRLPDGVIGWRTYNANNPDLNIPGLMAKANRILTFGECRAYGAPFPDARYKAGVRALPRLIAEHAGDPGAELGRRARDYLGRHWQGASQIVVGMRDPVIGHSAMRYVHDLIRDCPRGIMLEHAGHFLPEWADEFMPSVLASLTRQEQARREAGAALAAPKPEQSQAARS